MTRKASCCCGACSVEVEGDPVLNALCHCSNCRRRTGSAFGLSACCAGERVPRVRRVQLVETDGTTVLWKVDRWSDRTGIAGGCFIDPPLPEPSATVSNNARCAWLGLPGDWRTSL